MSTDQSGAKGLSNRQRVLKYLAVLSWAVWFGGLTFYTGVVVPTGNRVLGATEQGFVTQRVTHWLNMVGAVALAIMLCHAIVRRTRWLGATWAILAVLQCALFVLHVQLDALLDPSIREILDSERFSALHETYEFTTGMQWLAGVIYGWHLAAAP